MHDKQISIQTNMILLYVYSTFGSLVSNLFLTHVSHDTQVLGDMSTCRAYTPVPVYAQSTRDVYFIWMHTDQQAILKGTMRYVSMNHSMNDWTWYAGFEGHLTQRRNLGCDSVDTSLRPLGKRHVAVQTATCQLGNTRPGCAPFTDKHRRLH